MAQAILGELREIKALLRDRLRDEKVPSEAGALEMREVSEVQAREEILQLFASSKDYLYQDEISERLLIPFEQVATICDQLMAEGLVGTPDTENL